jgi:hypothetical protein
MYINKMVYYKKDSIAIREFIDKNAANIQSPKISFSSGPRTFIDKLKKKIDVALRNSSKPFFTLVSPSEFGTDFEKSANYSYISREVRDAFAPINKFKKTIQIRIGTRTFKIRFVLPATSSNLRMYSDACDIYARRMYIWLYIANSFAHNECSKEIDIFLYLSDEKKVLPDVGGDTIDRIHVNTAFTTSCAPTTEINIYRSEEWFKVLIHESFHCFGFDFSHHSSINREVASEILKQIPIATEILIYETYSEIWAEIMNVVITVSIENHGTQLSFVSMVEGMLNKELFFSLFQCAKILDHFGMNYEDFYKEEEKGVGIFGFKFDGGKRKQYREKTSVFSYYFLKTILLFHCNGFLEWSLENSGETVEFKSPETNVRKFSDTLILAKYRDPAFVAVLTQMKTKFFTRKVSKNNMLIYNTMRMTANEIV